MIVTQSVNSTPSRSRQWIVGSVQLGLVCALIGGAFIGARYMESNRPERVAVVQNSVVPTVSVISVTPGTQIIDINASGTVEVAAYVNLTPQVSGVINSGHEALGVGMLFEAHEPLFSIDGADLDLELQRLRAELQAKESMVQVEEITADNARKEWSSFDQRGITDLAARGPQVREAKANRAVIQALYDKALLDRDRAEFSLPFAGRVVESSATPGQYVIANQSYGRAYALDALQVSVFLDAEELALLDPVIGAAVTVDGQHLGTRVTAAGRIARLDAEVDPDTRLLRAIIDLGVENTAHAMLPGTFVAVRISGASRQGISVLPNEAMQEGGSVWVVEDDRLAQAPDINIVQRKKSEVLVSGIRTDQQVVIGLAAGARQGQHVRAISLESADASDGALSPSELPR